MVRLVSGGPNFRPKDNDGDRQPENKRPLFSIADKRSAEGQRTLDELEEAVAEIANMARPSAGSPPSDSASSSSAPGKTSSAGLSYSSNPPGEPTRLSLPSVEEFHFDEAAARNMASRFAPDQKPQNENRRPRYRRVRRIRWETADGQDDRSGDNRWDGPKPRRGNGRGLVRSFFTTMLVIAGAAAAFGFIQPLNDALPQRMGTFLSSLSDELSASIFGQADRATEFEVASGNPNSDKNLNSDKDVPVPGRPKTATMQPASVSPPQAPPAAAQPPAGDTGSKSARLVKPGGKTGDQTYALGTTATGTTVLKLGAAEGAGSEFGAPKPSAAPVKPVKPAPALTGETAGAAPAPALASESSRAASEPKSQTALATAPVQANRDRTVQPDRQKSDDAVPAQTMAAATAAATAADEQQTAALAPRPVTPSLSAARIERLLARAESFLVRGNIASARLLYLRVAEAGDPRGAKGMGMTYDPDVLARLPVMGLTPDREQANYWYEKAGPGTTLVIRPEAGSREVQASQAPESAERHAACAAKYKSYEPSTGLYTALSGAKRPCILP